MNLLEKTLAVYQDNYALLCAQAYGITGNVPDSEDVMQAVILHLLECPETITSSRNLKGFLQCAVRNRAIDLLRKRKHGAAPVADEVLLQCSCEDTAFDEMLCTLALRSVLSMQPEAIREAFIQHALFNVRIKDLARELGITPNALTQQFKRIKKKLCAAVPSEASHFYSPKRFISKSR